MKKGFWTNKPLPDWLIALICKQGAILTDSPWAGIPGFVVEYAEKQ